MVEEEDRQTQKMGNECLYLLGNTEIRENVNKGISSSKKKKSRGMDINDEKCNKCTRRKSKKQKTGD